MLLIMDLLLKGKYLINHILEQCIFFIKLCTLTISMHLIINKNNVFVYNPGKLVSNNKNYFMYYLIKYKYRNIYFLIEKNIKN